MKTDSHYWQYLAEFFLEREMFHIKDVEKINTHISCLITFFFDNRLVYRLRWSRGSVLAFSTQVRGSKPGRSRRIFMAKKSSARLPSEGK